MRRGRRGGLSVVGEPRGGSVSADVRAEWLTEELTRQMYFLDRARGELFAALAHRDYDGQVAAVERLGAVAKRMRERADRSARPVL